MAHFNHRWRGEESDADENFVRTLARQLDVSLHLGRADHDPVAKERSETHARGQRWSFLEQIAHEIGARYIATAHTADDQVETIIHRILRGTGLSGLRGIQQARTLSRLTTIVRPLLNVPRASLLRYLDDIGQSYRTDSSNADRQYTRARIRHELLPLLETSFNPHVRGALTRLASQASEVAELIAFDVDVLITERLIEESSDRAVVDVRDIETVAPYLIREMLLTLWRRQNWPLQKMNHEKWVELASIATDATASMQDLPDGVRIERTEGAHIILTRETH